MIERLMILIEKKFGKHICYLKLWDNSTGAPIYKCRCGVEHKGF